MPDIEQEIVNFLWEQGFILFQESCNFALRFEQSLIPAGLMIRMKGRRRVFWKAGQGTDRADGGRVVFVVWASERFYGLRSLEIEQVIG